MIETITGWHLLQLIVGYLCWRALTHPGLCRENAGPQGPRKRGPSHSR
jgi:hypothetical protein